MAWAQWAIDSVTEMTGAESRQYVALLLDGVFYDPKGTGPRLKPHIEIAHRLLETADSEFPDRLALMGNGLSFPWWIFSEVKAVRRSLMNTPDTSVRDAVSLFDAHREVLRTALESTMRSVAPQWGDIESILSHDVGSLVGAASDDFSSDEVAAYFEAARTLHLEVRYDAKLREENQRWSARRVGVWQLSGINSEGERFAFGVISPRLTANSLFHDPLFDPASESPAALLVRGLVLRRLAEHHLNNTALVEVGALETTIDKPKPRLRTIVAVKNQKLPEASMDSAIHFLSTYEDSEEAWAALERKANDSDVVLTVTREGFLAAHRSALRAKRRLEDPEREDVNVILPLGWDSRSRVVRFTFSRPNGDDETAE